MDSSPSNTNISLTAKQQNEISLDQLEIDFKECYQNSQANLQNIGEVDELRRFTQRARENLEYFNNKINEKINEHNENVTKIGSKLTLNLKKLDDLQPQNFETYEMLLQAINEENGKLEANLERYNELLTEKEKIQQVQVSIDHLFTEVFDHCHNLLQQLQPDEAGENGLTSIRIRTFKLFTTDESHVGNQCSICMEDINVGRRMRLLTCDGQHYFCQECIEGWFAKHNTCPLCRHSFS